MTAAVCVPLALLVLAPCLRSESPRKAAAPPSYSAESIVNSADFRAGFLAPFTLISVFGQDLAYSSGAAVPGRFPTILHGVSVRVGIHSCYLLYVSPSQINALVPYEAVAGNTTLAVRREGVAGPEIPIRLAAVAPSTFQLADGIALATHANGELLSPESPARPGEWVVAYLTGLGAVRSRQDNGVVSEAIEIVRKEDLDVRIGGRRLEPWRIYYAGLTPGTVGVYQINLLLPDTIEPNPEFSVTLGEASTKEGLRLWASPI